ncbi:hypothetical protein Dimus_001401 [Dionaea muscipula]
MSGKQLFGEGEEKEEEAVDTAKVMSSPTASELNKEVDDLVFRAIQLSFISDAAISLDDLEQDQQEEDPSGLLVIPVGSNGGTSQMLGLTEEAVEQDTFEMGNGVKVVDDEERTYEMEEIGGNKGDVNPFASGRSYARKGRETLFTRGRLRSPSIEMLKKYIDVMMGPTTRVTRKIMRRLPWRNEDPCLSRNISETSMLTGHTIQRAVNEESERCKKIAKLKEKVSLASEPKVDYCPILLYSYA